MRRSWTMAVQGVLLIIVAIIHLVMTPEIGLIVARNTSVKAFAFLWPPYALDHVVVGILVIAIGVTTILCADGVPNGDVRARRIALANAAAILCLPIAVVAAVHLSVLLSAPPFLVATVLLALTGAWMFWPILKPKKGT